MIPAATLPPVGADLDVGDPVAERPAVEPVNILLVDDRMSNLLSLEAMLKRPDYNLVLARSGREALGHLLRREFVVILLDVAMPDMDGFETASLIKQRAQSRYVPIIFVTASVYEMEHIFRGYTVGAVDYLRKPLDPHAVRAKVSVFVELHRERRRNDRQSKRLQEAERLLRERAEEALRESEAIYQTTFEEAPVGIGHASPDGHWTKVNRKLGEILGRASEELVGTSVSAIVESPEEQWIEATIRGLRSGPAIEYSGEHRLRATRPHVWGHVTLSAMRDPSGDVRRVVAVVADISERKEIEAERARLVHELRHAVAARDDFLSIAAHELRTPLTPLRLQTCGLLREIERLGEGAPLPDLLRRLGTIDRASARLEGLIDKLLDVSQMSVGKMALELEEVDLAEVVAEVAAQANNEVSRSGSSLTILTSGPVRGLWDRVRLAQVVMNLLSNAMKYGARRPIVVSVTREDDVAVLRVRDHGVGIPLGDQAIIFERFERLAPIRHHGGFGLGLWIVRQIVLAHGGTVQVCSQPGSGSEFTVSLPCAPPQAGCPTRVTTAMTCVPDEETSDAARAMAEKGDEVKT